MSFITFDYGCTSCAHREENKLVRRSEMDSQTHEAPDGRTHEMTKLPAGSRTHFRFADTKLK